MRGVSSSTNAYILTYVKWSVCVVFLYFSQLYNIPFCCWTRSRKNREKNGKNIAGFLDGGVGKNSRTKYFFHFFVVRIFLFRSLSPVYVHLSPHAFYLTTNAHTAAGRLKKINIYPFVSILFSLYFSHTISLKIDLFLGIFFSSFPILFLPINRYSTFCHSSFPPFLQYYSTSENRYTFVIILRRNWFHQLSPFNNIETVYYSANSREGFRTLDKTPPHPLNFDFHQPLPAISSQFFFSFFLFFRKFPQAPIFSEENSHFSWIRKNLNPRNFWDFHFPAFCWVTWDREWLTESIVFKREPQISRFPENAPKVVPKLGLSYSQKFHLFSPKLVKSSFLRIRSTREKSWFPPKNRYLLIVSVRCFASNDSSLKQLNSAPLISDLTTTHPPKYHTNQSNGESGTTEGRIGRKTELFFFQIYSDRQNSENPSYRNLNPESQRSEHW